MSKITIITIITIINCLALLFMIACNDSSDNEAKSFYGISKANNLNGDFPNLRALSAWFVTDDNNTPVPDAGTAPSVNQPLAEQVLRYIDDQLIRMGELQRAFQLASDPVTPDPIEFRRLLDMESREMKDIYLSLTLPKAELEIFSPNSEDKLAIFFTKLRVSQDEAFSSAYFSQFPAIDEESLENERVNLYNALAQEFFVDEEYREVRDQEKFTSDIKDMEETLSQIRQYFLSMQVTASTNGINASNIDSDQTIEGITVLAPKTKTFLTWIRFFSSDNLMGIFDANDGGTEAIIDLETGDNSDEGDAVGDDDAEGDNIETENTGLGLVSSGAKLFAEIANLVQAEGTIILQFTDGYVSGAHHKMDEVLQLQRKINKLGFRVGIDGYYGPETKRAVAKVQILLQFPVEGKFVSQGLYDAMDQKIAEDPPPINSYGNKTDDNGVAIDQLAGDSSADTIDLGGDNQQLFPVHKTNIPQFAAGSRGFGARRAKGRRHAANDLEAPCGTKIHAISDGKIEIFRGFYEGTNQIVIKHANFIARYGEVETSLPNGLRVGDTVKAGQHIANMGKLDNINRCMLHMELFKGTETGGLTVRRRWPYQRRADLIDPSKRLTELFQTYLRTKNK